MIMGIKIVCGGSAALAGRCWLSAPVGEIEGLRAVPLAWGAVRTLNNTIANRIAAAVRVKRLE
jgi:hypothetical protein